MKKPEKIVPHEDSPGYRKFLKKLAHRTLRREGKKDPENAPTKTREITWGHSR